ncbi:hypothetical protein CI789_21440 [Erwinia persicina]|uniref:hypothetical protein n=1 Tax=Erwinia persicina TaxID=55211 RepID=UPI000E4895DC|nr:hypothetical protein [Erwinia persicina]AXU97530.1 hypothetical protein CI789_21440 [Erwinia persicina]MBC3945019.1 hypothetical protein [Erwinia persicina]MCQ4103273.1 hypothetical protein [Erwinia persicina]UTX13452.1 hypothetical protein NOG67_02730 [Erwinia persicina]
MNTIDIIKDLWFFDDHIKNVTGPLIVAALIWSIKSLRKSFNPLIFIFTNNLSSNFIKLSTDEKVNALKIIQNHNENDDKHLTLINEYRLRDCGLHYPIPVLRVLFDYVHDNNIRLNSTGFLSFLDCNQIFNYERNTMPVHSINKTLKHTGLYLGVVLFFIINFSYIPSTLKSLYHSPFNFTNATTILSITLLVSVLIRFSYIMIEHVFSFAWAINFSKKMNKYEKEMKINEMIMKFKI